MVQRDKKKILVINQYYWPDRASTGQLLTELCEDLSRDFSITALVGTPSYSTATKQKLPSRSPVNGVTVIRVFNTSFSRGSIAGRLLNYLTFMSSALIKALLLERHDIVVVMSDPPTVNFIGYILKKLKRSRLVQICQDIYPELAIELEQADNPILISVFSLLNKLAQEGADLLVVISEGMRQKLIKKGLEEGKIRVIENWIDTSVVKPEPKLNPFSKKHGLAETFAVMHSGNVGLSQNLNLLIGAAEELKGNKEILFVIIGDGADKKRLMDRVRERGLGNVAFIDYQEKEELKYSLSSGDIHFVSLKRGLAGLIVPSKIYGIMAAGRPVISVMEGDSDIARMLAEYGFGTNLQGADAKGLAKGILDFYSNPSLLNQMGQRGRETVIKRNSRHVVVGQYLELFQKLA